MEYKGKGSKPRPAAATRFTTRRIVLGGLLGLPSLLGACSYYDGLFGSDAGDTGVRAAKGAPEAAAGYRSWRETEFTYRLQVGDEINVTHAATTELDQKVTILPDGRIYLPIVGAVSAADTSPAELSAALTAAYAVELRDPRVTVVPVKVGPQKIYVGGEVRLPGVYDFAGTVGIVEAIITAGGLRNSANEDEVVVLRRTRDNRAMMRTIDMSALLDGKPQEENLVLRQFDVVYVPRTTAAEIGVWVEQHITNILPFSRGFNYTINRDVRPGGGLL